MKKSLKKLAEKIPFYNQIVLPYHRLRAFMAANKFDYPATGLKVIGVTGTNGKTTTCFMIHRLLTEAGKKVGLMTTVAHGVGNDLVPQTEHMTTVSARLLNQRLREMATAGAEFVVLELTSHALAQYRSFGIPIDVAVMTNVTHEHLDYHKTFAKYRDAKRRLFRAAEKNRDGQKLGIINADDASAELFADDIDNVITYGLDKGDLMARRIKYLPTGVEYYVKVPKNLAVAGGGAKLHIKTHIPGKFNVYNSLAAVAVGLSYDLTPAQIEQGIAALHAVEGRMNRVDEGQDFDVIVDFAHTPDAFEKIYAGLPDVKGRIITLFGAAGRRDPSTRPLRGEIAGRSSEVVVITEDDPRDDDIAANLGQIEQGIIKSGNKNYHKIADREKAITFALKTAKKGDVVLLLGKGHEKFIERADGSHPWDEVAVARKILKKLVK
jgi:UDP-N-acetylmuramoyl-L-alanyl-D-glutamate--2,6-diaminopimelate ligase